MRIHVAARNEEYAKQFSKNNPNALNVVLHRGSSSLFSLLQKIIDGKDDYAIFVHDDVFLSSEINSDVLKLIKTLNTDWPSWGICGNAGVVVPTLAGGSRVCRYLFDPHGGPTLGGCILPAETVDGNTILINCRALRLANLQLPKFEGFQFYDISLSIETLAAGRSVLIAPDLACYHNSKGNQKEFDRAFGSVGLVEYLSSKVSNQTVCSLNGLLELPEAGNRHERFDICTAAVKNASSGRPEAKIAFVIRTSLRDARLLQRSVNSTLAFAAAAQNQSIKTYVLTDNTCCDAVKDLPNSVGVIARKFSQAVNTRHFLIREAVDAIDEDFILFLNEDSWVFSDEANYISDLLSCLPATAHLVTETQQFLEANLVPGETSWRNSSLRPQQRYTSEDWPLNFIGGDHMPICGIFYGRQVLLQRPKGAEDRVIYYSDYAVSFFSFLNENSFLFSTPKLVSATPLISSMESVLDIDENKQCFQEKAELARCICANNSNNVAFSVGSAFGSRTLLNNEEHVVGVRFDHLSRMDRRSLAASRFINGAVTFIFQPKQYLSNLKSIVLAIKSDGIRGGVRSIADMR